MLKIAMAVMFVSGMAVAQDWKPVEGRIMTRWAREVNPKDPWPEYPRPTMVREKWQSLNGLWDYAILGLDPSSADKWDGRILVPFPVESALSGVGRRLTDKQTLHYRRTFTVPADWRTDGQRTILHFGAVDWAAVVRINGKQVGEHQGGYAPFSLDITDTLKDGLNEVTVAVLDPTDGGGQPRGKQWAEPRGIWYTPTSGIWQTVWMEPAPPLSIGELRAGGTSDGVAQFLIKPRGDTGGAAYEVSVLDGGKALASMKVDGSGEHELNIKLGGITPWTPDTPKLYDVVVTASKGGKVVDRVKSYVAFRDVKLAKDADGIHRLMLNGKPTFMFGPLDQGFWPDGLYTPPNEAAMRFDIEAAKKMGSNMLRKHVKVESERFYYACDQLGIMVWQDIPSPFPPADREDGHFKNSLPAKWKDNYAREAREIITDFGNHPSIVMWVPFNEGWGQVDTAWAKGMVDEVKKWDPTRLVDCASGWTDTGNGDVHDVHLYPAPGMGPLQKDRASVLGEFGGLGLPVAGHTWEKKDNWGYVTYKDKVELTDAYVGLMKQLPALIGEGLCAAVYTQTTDVEVECNGWLTYDREVWKVDPARASAAMKGVYGPPPKVSVVVPRAGQAGGDSGWWYTLEKPQGDAWMKPRWSVEPGAWKQGKGGFGTAGTPGAVIGTEWNTGDIWARRGVELASTPSNPMLSIHHDEDAEVYINGELAASLKGYTTSYTLVPVSDKAAEILKKEKSVIIAVHCHQTRGGQYIDVGIVDLKVAAAAKKAVYLVELRGELGTEATAAGLQRQLDAGAGREVDAVVVRLDVRTTVTPGQPAADRRDLLRRGHDFDAALERMAQGPVRVAAWVANATGAGAGLPLGIREVYMARSASIGGCDALYQDVDGELRMDGIGYSLFLGKWSEALARAGYWPRLSSAIYEPRFILSYVKTPGGVSYLERLPAPGSAERLLTDEKGCLTLSAPLAVELGVCKGLADTEGELLRAMGLDGAEVVRAEPS